MSPVSIDMTDVNLIKMSLFHKENYTSSKLMQASINMGAANWIAIWLARDEEHTWSKMNQVGINMAAVNLITIFHVFNKTRADQDQSHQYPDGR